MKKYLFSALALPLLFACSSDELTEKEFIGNDKYAGIEKVDATFFMDERAGTRMATEWDVELGDRFGLAWLGGNTTNPLAINGNAYQNHPLTVVNENGKNIFKPQTSIYVGKYYLYLPYDETTVDVGPINFKSLENQVVTEGQTGQPWKDLAKNAIIIADKWTSVSLAGAADAAGKIWNKAGIGESYKIYPAFFSNQTGLEMAYKKNQPAFEADQVVTGATDITITYAAGSKADPADIYGGSIELAGAAKSFTYAPTVEPNAGDHAGDFWAAKTNLAAITAGNPGDGFTFTNAAIEFTADDEENGISTEEKTSGWFWLNSLPVTAGDGDEDTEVTPILETSYGKVTVKKDYTADKKYTVKDCAFALNVESGVKVWHPLSDAGDATKTPTVWALTGVGAPNTFINQYGNHKGKFAFEVDFSKGVMNGMHIKNDRHLQKALKYYIASGKTEDVVLNLDGASATDKTFKLSKISIALLQTINKTTNKVLVQACGTHNNPVKIIITQDGQTGELATATEVPALNKVFNAATDVYLSSDCEWTWGGGADKKTPVLVDANVSKITNEGILTVNATNVALATSLAPEVIAATTLANAKDATMNITQVTTVKNALTNLGTINVGSASNTSAELRAYGVAINNDATDATDLTKRGTINNYGVVGSSDGIAGSEVNNYGEINVMNAAAITLLKSNELNTPAFSHAFTAGTYMMGSVVIPSPFALVSVSNGAENGFIKYTWPAATTTYATPTGGVVKYNTIVVSGDITFTEAEPEIQYIEFNGTRTQVINPTNPADDTDMGHLTKLKGIIVNGGKSIIIEKNNGMNCTIGAFLGTGATIYKGGNFKYPAGATTNYFGTWTADQVVVW